MVYKVVYSKTAERDLEHLPRQIAGQIIKKVSQYTKHKTPLNFAKKLKGFRQTTYRFRVRDYRVIFRLDPQTKKLIILVVLKVAHRKDVYE